MRLFFILLFAFAGLCRLPALAQQADEQPLFRAGISMVHLDVQVVSGNQPVLDLTEDDFLVWDEDVPQRVHYFGQATGPLRLVLLLDVSGSVTRFLNDIASTAADSLRQLGPDDRAAVMVFAKETRLLQELTPGFESVAGSMKDAVRQRDMLSGTNINAAVIEAAKYLDEQSHAGTMRDRNAILIITDNVGLHYRLPDEKAIRALYAADAVLNAIIVGRGHRPKPPREGEYRNPDFTPADVYRLAEATGGESLQGGRAAETFRQILDRLRTRYVLEYPLQEGAQPGQFRRVRVDLTPEAKAKFRGATVRVREGYFGNE